MQNHQETKTCPTRSTRLGVCLGLGLAITALATTAAATPSAPGYSVGFIETTEATAGDVVVVGDAVFVGIGSFGGGTQSIVRIDGDGQTTIATGFNSLAGFVYDATNDRLLVGDNALEASGAVTGDTVYAIPDPFGNPLTPPTATTLALLADGSIPGTSDLVLDPGDPTGDTLLIGDASGSFPPAGIVLELAISSVTSSTLTSGLGFTAGLAVDGDTLFIGEALLDFSGQISTLDLSAPSTPSVLAALPDGLFDLEVGPGGRLYATSGGAILEVDTGDGSLTTVASGFGFGGGFTVTADGTIYAIDGFPAAGEANRVWVLTAVPEPGTSLLLAFGFVGLAGLARSRN